MSIALASDFNEWREWLKIQAVLYLLTAGTRNRALPYSCAFCPKTGLTRKRIAIEINIIREYRTDIDVF